MVVIKTDHLDFFHINLLDLELEIRHIQIIKKQQGWRIAQWWSICLQAGDPGLHPQTSGNKQRP